MPLSNNSRQSESFEHFRIFCDSHGHYFSVNEKSSFSALQPSATRQNNYEIQPLLGEGWMDMQEFGSGILTARMHWKLSTPFETSYESYPDTVNLGVMMDGQGSFSNAGRDGHFCDPGTIYIRNGNPGAFKGKAAGGSSICGVSIDISRSLIARLEEDGTSLGWLGQKNSFAILKPSQSVAVILRALGHRMLSIRTEASTLARIELESLSLDLLVKLIAAGPDAQQPWLRKMPQRWLVALDDALDLLHTEWSQPHTIAQLARRVGINECYLKMLFRERVGMGIAAYLRQLRMRHAREMFESSGCTVQQVAMQCGYTNTRKFAQALSREYGMTPYELRHGNEK